MIYKIFNQVIDPKKLIGISKMGMDLDTAGVSVFVNLHCENMNYPIQISHYEHAHKPNGIRVYNGTSNYKYAHIESFHRNYQDIIIGQELQKEIDLLQFISFWLKEGNKRPVYWMGTKIPNRFIHSIFPYSFHICSTAPDSNNKHCVITIQNGDIILSRFEYDNYEDGLNLDDFDGVKHWGTKAISDIVKKIVSDHQ